MDLRHPQRHTSLPSSTQSPLQKLPEEEEEQEEEDFYFFLKHYNLTTKVINQLHLIKWNHYPNWLQITFTHCPLSRHARLYMCRGNYQPRRVNCCCRQLQEPAAEKLEE